MIKLTFIKFIRSKATITGLSFILLSGIASLFLGKQFIERQKTAIEETASFQKEFIENYVSYIKDDLGLLLYYLKFSLVNEPQPLAGISIGQRDVNPSIQSVTIRNLESQKWDTGLNNPANLLLGNLDLGFVIIYLFPLLLIAFSYNLLSEEKEEGTWKMILFQAESPLKVLRRKMLTSLGAVFFSVLLLLLLAKIILAIPFSSAFLAVVFLVVLYLLLWAALCYWVISWQKSSAFNALMLIGFWVALTILSPAIVNTYISNAYPVPEALEMVVKQRQGSHEKWDMEKSITMTKFYAHYPQFRKYPLPKTQFSWLWYYAMHQMGDDESVEETTRLNQKLLERERVSKSIALVLPVLHTQLALNNLTQTGLKNHLEFLDSTKAFHEKKRLFFYEKIFENKPVNSINWKGIRVQKVSSSSTKDWLFNLLPIALLSFLLTAISEHRLRKDKILY